MVKSHTCLLTLSHSITFTRSWLPFPAGKSLLLQEGQAEGYATFCCGTAHSYQSWVSQAKVPGHPLVLVFMQLFVLRIFSPAKTHLLLPWTPSARFFHWFLIYVQKKMHKYRKAGGKTSLKGKWNYLISFVAHQLYRNCSWIMHPGFTLFSNI